MRKPRPLVVLVAMLALAPAARAALRATTLPQPIAVEFTLALDDANSLRGDLRGDLVRYDAERFWLRHGAAETEYKWSQLSWGSQYAVRAQLIDKRNANDWLDLADLAVKNRLAAQVRPAVDRAVGLDPSVRPRGDAILKALAARMAVVKYQKATPQQDADAIQKAKDVAKGVAGVIRVTFVTIETPHFILFTDWPKEHDYLKSQCEEAYAAVSQEFTIPVKENVFVGKLPVFMFATREGFARFATTVDGFPSPVPEGLAGYYSGHEDASGHMAMWRPEQDPSENDPKGRFSHTLMHEFTHAFIARYRTNQPIPRWLNEGMAEFISYKRYPRKIAYPLAKAMAEQQFAFADLFDDQKMPGGDMYPVMQTMVEALVKDNPRGFIRMFNDIKDGVEPEVAIKRQYKATYKDFENAWRKYARSLQTPYVVHLKGK